MRWLTPSRWSSACEVTRLRVFVGGDWTAPAGAADLGRSSAQEAAGYLLSLGRSPVGPKGVLAATLADSVVIWPALLRLARDETFHPRTRRTAMFWLGQAAEGPATLGLPEILATDTMDRDVRQAAVFALSRQPRARGSPALITSLGRTGTPTSGRERCFG